MGLFFKEFAVTSSSQCTIKRFFVVAAVVDRSCWSCEWERVGLHKVAATNLGGVEASFVGEEVDSAFKSGACFGSTSADNQDFAAKAMQSGTVRFRAGETSRFVDVAVAGDTTFEADETFAVTLSNASWGSMIGTGQAVGTILNDESVVSIAGADAVRAEGNMGSTAFTFTLTRTGSTEGSSRVDWTVSGSGAAAATARDFSGNRLPSGSVTFRKGETERTIIVQAATDRTAEADEGFTVTLVRPTTGTSLGVASANGTILNDDGTVLSSAIGARSALAPTAMTFLAPAETVTVSSAAGKPPLVLKLAVAPETTIVLRFGKPPAGLIVAVPPESVRVVAVIAVVGVSVALPLATVMSPTSVSLPFKLSVAPLT